MSITSIKLLLITIALSFTLVGCKAPTRDQIVSLHPEVEEDSGVPADDGIICPFHRMIARTGLYDPVDNVDAETITKVAEQFGCDPETCFALANLIGAGQGRLGSVDMLALHQSKGISHDCGLQFELDGTRAIDSRRDATIAQLNELAVDGQITIDDLYAVKLQKCEEDRQLNADPDRNIHETVIGVGELMLIFAYLGGADEGGTGTIAVSDVELFLNGSMPLKKTNNWLNQALLDEIKLIVSP